MLVLKLTILYIMTILRCPAWLCDARIIAGQGTGWLGGQTLLGCTRGTTLWILVQWPD